MNGNQNAAANNFQYVMPDDDEDEYEDDAGEEMVDMEDDEAQPENDQLVANKVQEDEDAQDDANDEENRLPGNGKAFG